MSNDASSPDRPPTPDAIQDALEAAAAELDQLAETQADPLRRQFLAGQAKGLRQASGIVRGQLWKTEEAILAICQRVEEEKSAKAQNARSENQKSFRHGQASGANLVAAFILGEREKRK